MTELDAILTEIYAQNANPKRAVEMSKYMRNLFPFYGISKPLRAALDKPVLRELKNSAPDLQLINKLWNKPVREYHYFCLEYLFAVKKHWPEDIIDLFEQMIVSNSWWDSVDFIATKLVGLYFKHWPEHQKTIIGRWTKSDNMWLNRSAIIHQLKYKKDTDTDLLFNIIRKHSSSNEFFIQKAIGWALREYAYTDSQCVKNFIAIEQLKPLSKREALKRMINSSED